MRLITTSAAALLVFVGCASVQKSWLEAERQNDRAGYEAFVREHPDAPQVSEARRRIEKFRFEQADEQSYARAMNQGSSAGFASYLREFPTGNHAEEAALTVRSLRLEEARSQNTVIAYEEFLTAYPADADADSIRSSLPYMRARRLGELACAMYSPALVSGPSGNQPAYEPSKEYPVQLEEFRRLLEAGAEPAVIRISGFSKPGMIRLSASVSKTDFGKTGNVVPASAGGMTLEQYLKATGQKEALAILERNESR